MKFVAIVASAIFFFPAVASAGAGAPTHSDCLAMGRTVIDASAASTGQRIRGTRGDDCIIGSAHGDIINGRGGNDIIMGGGGDDHIRGGRGDDIIFGGMGNDDVRGGSGNDTINGGGGDDDLRGNRGDDSLDGGDGNDTLRGGSGNDALSNGARYSGGGGSDGCDGDNRSTSGRAAPRGCRSRNDNAAPGFNALVSSRNDRVSPMLLNGAVVDGDIFAFITDVTGNLTKVEFILNGRKVFQEVDQLHYDLCGSAGSGDSVAARFPTRYAAAGANMLIFRAHYDGGDVVDVVTRFFRR